MAISHTNVITFTSSAISGISYVTGSFHITSGQPVRLPPVIERVGSTWTISVDCGRNGSQEMANGYVQQALGAYHMFVEEDYAADSSRNTNIPAELNFYFTLTMTFGSQEVEVYVAQAGVDLINFWWIGGFPILNSCPDGSSAAFLMLPDATTYVVTLLSKTVYEFGLTPLAP